MSIRASLAKVEAGSPAAEPLGASSQPASGLTAALYCRASTAGQRDSIAQQESEGRAWIHRHGHSLPDDLVFKENVSGTRSDRAGFWDLIKAIETGRVHVLVAWDLWRAGSNEEDAAILALACRRNNVRIELVSTNGQYILDNPENRLNFRVNLALADYRREKFIIDGARGKNKLAPLGYVVRGPPPFGYRIDGPTARKTYVPTEHAALVGEIFERYVRGATLIPLATWLRDLDLPPAPNGQPRVWQYQSVARILDDVTYIGYMRWKGNLYRGHHQPLVSRDLFEAALDRREKQRAKHPGSPKRLGPKPLPPVACPVPGCGKRFGSPAELGPHFQGTPGMSHHVAAGVLKSMRAG